MGKQFLDYAGLQQYTRYLKQYINSLDIQATAGVKQVTYAELTALKSNKELVPGQFYRLTDYVTTTNGKAVTGNSANTANLSKSAGHPFDLILLALDADAVSHEAYAVAHKDDTYFANQNLGKWEIHYDVENNPAYGWAAANGKGVIYYMRDERNNVLAYDFKNIQFKRGTEWKYTFDNNGADASLLSTVSNNVIELHEKGLNNIVFLGDTFNYNFFGMQSFDNTCGNKFSQNVFSKSYRNTFGNDCYYNIADDLFIDNTIGDNVRNNHFEHWFADNIIGSNCAYNDFKINTRYIKTPEGTPASRFINNYIKAIGVSKTNPLVLDRQEFFGDIGSIGMNITMDRAGKIFATNFDSNGVKGYYKDSALDEEWKEITINSSSSEWEEIDCDCQAIQLESIENLFKGGN